MAVSSRTRRLSKLINPDRAILDEQLDWLTVDHDDLQEELSERIRSPKYHPSMATIDRWEEETIERIRQTAIFARRALIGALDQHVVDVQERLNDLTTKLTEARYGKKFFAENDIQEWTMTLHQLKQIPSFPILPDPQTNIQGIVLDLRKHQRMSSFDSTSQKLSLPYLISTLHDFIPPTSMSPKNTEADQNEVHVGNDILSNISRTTVSKVMTIREQPQNEPSTTISSRKTGGDQNEVHAGDDVLSNIPRATLPKTTIIREQPKNEISTTKTRIRRAHAEIPFDSRTQYPLRGPANIYH